MTVGLFYTALLTPPVVAFHWLDSVCDQVPTLWADTVFDVLFLADILMTFLTGKSFATPSTECLEMRGPGHCHSQFLPQISTLT